MSNAYGASALTVTRCNQLSDGVYRPVLIVVHGDMTTVHALGDDGLTRSILFNADAALEWAQAIYGADATVASQSTSCDDNPTSSGPSLTVGDDDDGGYLPL